MKNKVILLVEGVEYLTGTGAYQGRNPSDQPAVILLDLKLPKLDGLELLRKVRADERIRLLPKPSVSSGCSGWW